MIRSTIVSDDSWFGKCAGVHKPLIHNPKPSAGLLSCFKFRTTCLGVKISYIFGSYVHSKTRKRHRKMRLDWKHTILPTSPKESFPPNKEELVILIIIEHNYTELVAMITNIARNY